MSLLRYFKPSSSQPSPTNDHVHGLPDAGVLATRGEKLSFSSANDNVSCEVVSQQLRRRKRGPYSNYTPEVRCKIAKYAIENGNKSAVRKFSSELGKAISESTVRSIRDSFKKSQRTSIDVDVELSEFPRNPRGVKPLLGELDCDIQAYIRELRRCGGIVNAQICIAAALGIVRVRKPTLLPEFGGTLVLDKPWAKSFLNRLGFVRRKATKAARKLPGDFHLVRDKFHETVTSLIKEFDIPDNLVINFDQTGVKLAPVSVWTMEEHGVSQVAVAALDN